MPGSTILNQRQHVGLQKLSALAGITHSSLGPNKKYKFIQDDKSGESALVCSCFRIFENLELTCAVGQLVFETIQAHQNVYHTGSGCLLFLAGAWSRAASECLQKGISLSHIISAMSEGFDICLDVCSKCSISAEGVGVAQSENVTAMPRDLGLHQPKKPIIEALQASSNLQGTNKGRLKTITTSGHRKLKLSRHFCEAKSENVSAVLQSPQLICPDIAHIAAALSHGSSDAMNLAVKSSYLQSENRQDNSCLPFDITKVVTCLLPGFSEEHACVIPGCIVRLSAEQASLAHQLKEQDLKVALITGDLANDYRHLGFSRPAGMQHVSDQPAFLSSSQEEEWLAKVVALLLSVEVNLILVGGLVNEKVIQHCCRHHILVVEKVKASVLKTFASATGAVPVTYATQLSRQCVGTEVKAEIWRDLSNHDRSSPMAVNISTRRSSGLVTVVLTSCVHGKLQALEDQFWACAYRLDHALKDRALLPGAGVTEMLCVYHLSDQANHHVKHCTEQDGDATQQTRAGTAANHYRGEVLRLMADGLIDYISTVMVNTGGFSKLKARTVVSQRLQNCGGLAAKFSQLFLVGEKEDAAFSSPTESDDLPAVKVYDNLSVKKEAWRKALDLVFLVLQTDAEIITGIDRKGGDEQQNLMFL